MKTELRYGLFFALLSSIILVLLARILLLHAPDTTEQFISSCQTIAHSLVSTKLPITLLAVFVLSMVALKVITSIVKTLQLSRSVSQNTIPKQNNTLISFARKHSIQQNRIVVVESDALFAVTLGWFSKKIVISSALQKTLSKNEMEAVLLHELHHYKNNHSILLFLADLIADAFFFIPVLRDSAIQMTIHFEKDADASAIHSQQTNQFIKNALVKLLSSETEVVYSSLNWHKSFPHFESHILHERIAAIQKESKVHTSLFRTKRLFISVAILAFAALLPSISQSVYAHTDYSNTSSQNTTQSCSFLGCVSSCISQELPQSRPIQSENLGYSPAH